MNDYLDFIIPAPAILSYLDPKKPLCNGGSKPKSPPKPAPITAPPRSEPESGVEDAIFTSRRRKGLRKTILSNMNEESFNSDTRPGNAILGSSSVLGSTPTGNKLV